jgi:hypothetical protein
MWEPSKLWHKNENSSIIIVQNKIHVVRKGKEAAAKSNLFRLLPLRAVFASVPQTLACSGTYLGLVGPLVRPVRTSPAL